MPNVKMRVEGLPELRKALKAAETGLHKEIPRVFRDIAKEEAKRSAPHFPRRTGAAQASVRGQGTQRGGMVVAGNAKTNKYIGWLIFGGRAGRNKSVFRPRVPDGRYIWPQVQRDEQWIRRQAENMLDELHRKVDLI